MSEIRPSDLISVDQGTFDRSLKVAILLDLAGSDMNDENDLSAILGIR
jgi:hypothetical protein